MSPDNNPHQKKDDANRFPAAEPAKPQSSGAKQHTQGVEGDPAVERGERISTSKMIARGGKEDGPVPGATEKKPS